MLEKLGLSKLILVIINVPLSETAFSNNIPYDFVILLSISDTIGKLISPIPPLFNFVFLD